MGWRGFLTESKSYMDYPNGSSGRFAEWNYTDVCKNGWTVRERRIAKCNFWRRFPRAFIYFYFYTMYDWYKKQYYNVMKLIYLR